MNDTLQSCSSSALDRADLLTAKSSQLRALLALIAGSGFSNFAQLNAEHQECIIWLAADLCNTLTDSVHEAVICSSNTGALT